MSTTKEPIQSEDKPVLKNDPTMRIRSTADWDLSSVGRQREKDEGGWEKKNGALTPLGLPVHSGSHYMKLQNNIGTSSSLSPTSSGSHRTSLNGSKHIFRQWSKGQHNAPRAQLSMSDWRRQRSDVLFPKTTENIWKQSFELCMQMVFGKSFSHRGACSALTMSADKSCPRLHVCTTSNIHFLHHYRTLRPSSQTQLTDTREKRDQKKKKEKKAPNQKALLRSVNWVPSQFSHEILRPHRKFDT